MPGMNSGLDPADPTLVAAFRSALLHQGLIAAALFLLLWLLWGASRNWVRPEEDVRAPRAAEPAGRRVLRTGFGLLWVFDGVLQAQPRMPGGLPSQVIEPTAQSSPRWVQDLVNAGGTIWSDHPITRSRPPRPRCGSRLGSACGCWSPSGAGGPAAPVWPAWPGD
jgi:hypothetical protein